jgi:hypothetical protein
MPFRFLPSCCRAAAVLLVALFLSIASSSPVAAQQPGEVQGTVRDELGAPVSGARVEAAAGGGGFRRAVRTDRQGRYRLAGLRAGPVHMRVRHLGYAMGDTTVEVPAGGARTHDFVLRLRILAVDTVTVTSSNPAVIRRDDTEFSTEISEAAIQLLPLRPDIDEVVALTPGARGAQVWGGATEQANNYQVDGLSANHPGTGGDLISLSLNWLEAVEVRGLGAAAEFGNFQGGLVNLVTKSGTNRREGMFRTAVDAAALSATTLQEYDVAAQVDSRYDVEAELRGPLVRDRLFFYVAGQMVRRTDRLVNHLDIRGGFFAPDPVETLEARAFGKLSWHATAADRLTLSAGYTDVRVDGFGATGYEQDAFVQSAAPTYFFTGLYSRVLGPSAVLEASVAGFSRDERRDPEGDPSEPGVVLFGTGERPSFNAAAIRERLAPSSVTGSASVAWEARTGGLRHRFKAGGELSGGDWIYQRLRNGGMTWRPGFGRVYDSFNPTNTSTWVRNNVTPVSFGGEVRLEADVRSGAVYLQDQVDFGSRLSISPGVRLGWWRGYLTPHGDVGPRFRAVEDRAIDPRLGVTLDVTGRNDLVIKAHWGRYHQGLFAQFFDRAEGGNVFQNEQLWYYFGQPESPGQTWTQAERDALALSGRLQLFEDVRLNETGPVVDYRQPYVDQLVVGVEKQLGRWWKAELVYVNRRNGDMMALVDRNRDINYTEWRNVRVLDAAGDPITFNGEEVVLPQLYLPNFMLVDQIKAFLQDRGEMPPGLDFGDTLALVWDPDYVLTRAPGGRRVMHQGQLVVRMGHPRWGGMASLVYTRLQGNLDNVSGYHESERFAGPYVNPNQSVNAFGWLGNSAELELKVSLYGALPGGFRGGLAWTQASGDRAEPTFQVSSFYAYQDSVGRDFGRRLVVPVSGQPLYLRQRGANQLLMRSLVDLHLERGMRMGGAEWMLTADGFNVLGTNTPTRYNTIVNGALAPGSPLGGGIEPEMVFGAVRERVRPRSLRLGAAIRF